MGWSCLSTAASRPSEFAPDRGKRLTVRPRRSRSRRGVYAKVATQRNGQPSAVEGRGININTDRRSIMSYAIVGFGKIGQALAHAFARKNIDVTVASRQPPEALAPQAREIGPTVIARSLPGAL